MIASQFLRNFASCMISLGLPIALVAMVGTFSGSIEMSQSAIEIMIKIVAVVGLYIFIGNSGIVSFGHVGFIAIGAYASAWQTCCEMLKPVVMSSLPEFLLHRTIPPLPATIAAGLFAMLVGLPVGAIILRLSGLAASIASFALLFVVNVVYSNIDGLTQGVGSIVGLPTFVSPWTGFLFAISVIALAFLYQNSRYGLLLRATREDEVAARAAGANVTWCRLIAFALSAFVLGIAGAMYGSFLGTISVDTFFLDMTFMLISMLVVGGMYSLSGAVFGVLAISILTVLLRRLAAGVTLGGVTISIPDALQTIVIAITMLAILRLRPAGLVGVREVWTKGPFLRFSKRV